MRTIPINREPVVADINRELPCRGLLSSIFLQTHGARDKPNKIFFVLARVLANEWMNEWMNSEFHIEKSQTQQTRVFTIKSWMKARWIHCSKSTQFKIYNLKSTQFKIYNLKSMCNNNMRWDFNVVFDSQVFNCGDMSLSHEHSISHVLFWAVCKIASFILLLSFISPLAR